MIGAAFKLTALALVAGLCAVAAHAQPSAVVVGGPFQALPQNINAGATDVTVLRFNLARTGMVATDFTDLDVTVAGTASSSDVAGFDLYADEDNNGQVSAGDTLLASAVFGGVAGFTGFADTLPAPGPMGIRNYLVAADISGSATSGATFSLSFTPADVTVSPSTQGVIGTPIAGGTFTIATPTGAVMSVERGGNIVASGFTSHDNLGSVPSSGAPFVYDIKNIGTTDLTLTGTPDAVEVSNMVNCNVLVTQPSPLVITPAGQVSFTLDVTPSGSAPAIGFRVSIPSDDPASPYMFNVIGQTIIAVPASLAITTQPGGGTGGVAWTQQPVVEVLDSSSNLMTGFNGQVMAEITASTGTAGASLLGTTTVNASGGVATFTDLAIDLAGTGYTLSFSVVAPLPPVDSAPFDITVGAAAGLRVATQPGGASAAAAFVTQPVVEVVDAGGNVVTSDSSTNVDAAISTGTGTSGALLGGTTTVQASAGIVTFTNLQIDLAGSGYTLDFSATGFTTVVSDPFGVAGAADALAVAVQPGGAVENTAFVQQPAVEIRDAAGIVVAADNSTVVTAALIVGTGTLSGTLTAQAVNGVATFTDLEIDLAGSGFEIEFTAGALTPAVSDPFDVAGPATQLAVAVQPAGAARNAVLLQQPVVEIRDAAGVLVATDNTTQVTVSLGATVGPPSSGAMLSGTLTVTAVNGVATFTDLEIDTPGVFTLDFEDNASVLTGTSSAPFRVTGGPPMIIPGCAALSGAGGLWLMAGALVVLGVAARRRRAA